MLRPLTFLTLATLSLPLAAETLKHTLANGMTVIIKEDKRAPVAVSRLWYRVGSIDEQPGKTGLSHALEHMMFKGTQSVPAGEFSRRIAALGGQDNAYTSRDSTVYVTDIAVRNLPEVLKLEGDRMANLNFSDRDFANEMNVIKEERRMRSEDDPGGKLWENLNLAAYRLPNLRAPVIGYRADLDQLTAADLRDWYRRWYAPNNATLIIVGDVNARQTLKTVEQHFGSLPKSTIGSRNQLEDSGSQATESTSEALTAQPLFALAWQVPSLKKMDEKMPYALDVLSDILSGDSSSRFDKNLIRGKEKALGINVSCDLLSRETPLLTISGLPAAGTDTRELVALVHQQIADIAKNGVSRQELQRIRRRSEAQEIYARDSMTHQAALIGMLEANGFSYRDEAEIRRRLAAVTAAEVQAAARLLQADKQTLAIVNPRPGTAPQQAAPATPADLNPDGATH